MYGGNSCTHTEDGDCLEQGGNCNDVDDVREKTVLLRAPSLHRMEVEAGVTKMLAKVGDRRFAAWSCEEGSYVVYRMEEDGDLTRIETEKDRRNYFSSILTRGSDTVRHGGTG